MKAAVQYFLRILLRFRLHLVGIRLGYINLKSNAFVPLSSAHKYPADIIGVSLDKPGMA